MSSLITWESIPICLFWDVPWWCVCGGVTVTVTTWSVFKDNFFSLFNDRRSFILLFPWPSHKKGSSLPLNATTNWSLCTLGFWNNRIKIIWCHGRFIYTQSGDIDLLQLSLDPSSLFEVCIGFVKCRPIPSLLDGGEEREITLVRNWTFSDMMWALHEASKDIC